MDRHLLRLSPNLCNTTKIASVKIPGSWIFFFFIYKDTHMVPATRVLMWVTLSGKSFARPKSPILGTRSLSSKMLVALISRWTIGGSASSWRNERPRAVPRQIEALLGQSKGMRIFLGPVRNIKMTLNECANLLEISNNLCSHWQHANWLYQAKRCLGYCSPDTHRPTSDYCHQHSIQAVEQD